MTQARLFGSDAPALSVTPAIPLNMSVHSHERKRLQRQSLDIVALLRQRDASNFELAAIARKYTGRVSEARQAGYDIRVVERDHVSGRCVYRLLSEPA